MVGLLVCQDGSSIAQLQDLQAVLKLEYDRAQASPAMRLLDEVGGYVTLAVTNTLAVTLAVTLGVNVLHWVLHKCCIGCACCVHYTSIGKGRQ